MASRSNWRKTARSAQRARGNHSANSTLGRSRYRRPLRLEPLEDRRLLALVTVTTLEDSVDFNDGVTSLREAIFATNTVPGADTIEFASELTAGGPATILLTKGELSITDSLTITGPGAESLKIDASGNDPTPEVNNGEGTRVFRIADVNSNDFQIVSMQGVTLTGGDSGPSRDGGAIFSTEHLSLEAVVIRGNSASSGGAILSDRGSLRILDSEIAGNSISSPTGAMIQARMASPTSAFQLLNTSVSENLLNVSRGTLISISGENATIVGATIDGNSFGTGVFDSGKVIRAVGLRTNLTIDRSTVSNNTGATGMSFSGSTLTVQDTFISNNSETGILLAAGVTKATISNSKISGNSMGVAGGLYGSLGGTVTIRDSEISGNRGKADGSYRAGGAFFPLESGGKVVVERCKIFDNDGGSHKVGGIDVRRGELQISNSEIYNNSGGSGIGITASTATISNSTIRDNSAAGYGGGISGTYSNITVIDCTITGNSAGMGGGIQAGASIADREMLTIVRCIISKNVASKTTEFYAGVGGGIFAGDTLIVDSTIANNTAETGGGACLRRAEIVQSTISGNHAILAAGLHLGPELTKITHSTITQNRADGLCGGIFVTGGTLVLDHSILADNGGPTAPDLTGLIGSAFELHFSLLGENRGTGLALAPVGSPDANGNLIVSGTSAPLIRPHLGPLGYNGGPMPTHALLPESPAINAGDLAAVAGIGGVQTFDQRGEPFTRVFGGRIDMGAVEVIPAGFLPGDFFRDGEVDARDYGIWRNTMGTNVAPGSGADGNGDGVIDSLDYAVWKSNYGARTEQEAAFGFVQDIASIDQGVEMVAAADGKETSPSTATRRAPVQVVFDNSRSRGAVGKNIAGQTESGARWVVDVSRRDRVLEAWAAMRSAPDRRVPAESVVRGEFARADAEALDDALEAMSLGELNPRQSRGLSGVR